MFLKLTTKGDNKLIVINPSDVKIFETDAVGATKVVFGADLVRVVNETLEDIAYRIDAIGIVAAAPVPTP